MCLLLLLLLLLRLLLLLLRLLLLFLLLLLLLLSCPARQQGCLLLRLVLTGTDVNIHPIPHFQKSFPSNPHPSPFPPAQHFACQSPPSSLLRSFVPSLLRSFAPCSLSIKPPHFMDNLSEIPAFIHENAPFHGQPFRNPPFIHENAPFHGQPHQFPPLIHEKPIFHGQPFRNPPIHP